MEDLSRVLKNHPLNRWAKGDLIITHYYPENKGTKTR
jgi:hypothetical protein